MSMLRVSHVVACLLAALVRTCGNRIRGIPFANAPWRPSPHVPSLPARAGAGTHASIGGQARTYQASPARLHRGRVASAWKAGERRLADVFRRSSSEVVQYDHSSLAKLLAKDVESAPPGSVGASSSSQLAGVTGARVVRQTVARQAMSQYATMEPEVTVQSVQEQSMRFSERAERGNWREKLDLKGWAAEVREVAKESKAESSLEDAQHLAKIMLWANGCYATGILLSGVAGVPPLAAALLVSTGMNARWTMVGHHVTHGGYNRVRTGEMSHLHGRKFARGTERRLLDWLDWMLPEAWDVEHNKLHHYRLGEEEDPDLVERNLQPTLLKYPLPVRYAAAFGIMLTWKWFYYMPNTLKELAAQQRIPATVSAGLKDVNFNTGTKPATTLSLLREAWSGNFGPLSATLECAAPYAAVQFALIPLAFGAVLGPAAALQSLAVMLVAEALTNLHSFVIIAPNHCGDDVYRFETPAKPWSDEFLLRACIGSVNFRTGGDVNDFFHGWLNYQIEHHMFPDMSMLQYQRMAPKVKAICEKYNVPYVQQNVFYRVYKTVEIMVGRANMLVWEKGD